MDPDSDPESEDDGSDLDEPDTPSPTQTAFPSGISSSALAVQPTQTATVDIGNIGTEISAPISILASDPAASGVTALPATSQDDQAQEQDITQVTEQQGLINRGGVIAMGTLSKAPLLFWATSYLPTMSWDARDFHVLTLVKLACRP